MRAGMTLGSMAITLGGATLILIIDPIGVGDGAVIMPASTRLGMILGIMADSTVAIGEAIGDTIIIIIPPIMRNLCVIMPTDVQVSMAITQQAEAAV